jgi:cell division protein ZapA
MKARVVHVQIFGQQYAIRSELDPQYVGELSAYIDDKMRSAAREIASTDPVRIAVVAALNIADELFRARAQDPENPVHRWATRAAEIERLLDAVLESPAPPAIAAG